MVPVIFSIGSNIGDKIKNIETALDLLHAADGLAIEHASSFYETPPWGIKDQDWFVNICASGQTSLPAPDLLHLTQSVEKQIGREKAIRWGPRLIDIDILFFGDHKIDIPDLTVPHKSISTRAFVLVPLLEIAAHITLYGKKIPELLEGPPPGEAAAIKKMPRTRWAANV